jgi:hypothetical protein
MNSLVALPIVTAVPTAVPALPGNASTDELLVTASQGLLSVIDAIEQMHREHAASGAKGDADERRDYQDLLVVRENHITTLIEIPATSSVGLQAKAAVLRSDDVFADYAVHQDIAVSLAQDLCGASLQYSLATIVDPTFTVIGEHHAAARAHVNAVRAEFGFEEERVSIRDMDPETLKQYQALEAATAAASDRMHIAGKNLLTTLPTTAKGIAALCLYMAPLLEEDGSARLPLDAPFGDFETAFGAFCRMVAEAVHQMQPRS